MKSRASGRAGVRACKRHISSFGNPIKEDNPFSVAAIFPRCRRIPAEISFSEKTLPVDLRRVDPRSDEHEDTARDFRDRSLLAFSLPPGVLLSRSAPSSVRRSIPTSVSLRSFGPLFHLGFLPIISTVHDAASRYRPRQPAIFLRRVRDAEVLR